MTTKTTHVITTKYTNMSTTVHRNHPPPKHAPAAVVVVNGLLGVVVGDEEVVRDVVPLLDHVRLASAHIRDVHLTVPAVERAVVATLPDPKQTKNRKSGTTKPL
jgi:xanthosine utilization system XapX-like protein